MRKVGLLEIVEEMTEEGDVGLDALIYTLAFRRAVEKGLAAADSGDQISFEEFEAQSEQWLASP